jgi:hypothetical protein
VTTVRITPTRTAVTHAIASTFLVTACSGRQRWVLVFRCPQCGRHHVSHSRTLLDTVIRKSACGHGRLQLHPVVRQREAA